MSKALMTPYVCFAKRTYCECAAKLLKIYENKNLMVYWLKKKLFFLSTHAMIKAKTASLALPY